MSDVDLPEDLQPERLSSFPNAPLSLQQVAKIQYAYEKANGVETTVWVEREQPETVMLNRGHSVLTSENATILEFVIESDSAFRCYRYQPAPAGGHWTRAAPAEKGTFGGKAWSESIVDLDYARLSALIEEQEQGGAR